MNVAGTYFDFHIPINMGTATVSSLLGVPGVAALVIIKLYIMPKVNLFWDFLKKR